MVLPPFQRAPFNMKKTFIFLWSAALLAAIPAHGQSFTNLNFESAQIVPVSTNANGSINIATANALPGWAAFAGITQLSLIAYDTPNTVAAPAVELLPSEGKSCYDRCHCYHFPAVQRAEWSALIRRYRKQRHAIIFVSPGPMTHFLRVGNETRKRSSKCRFCWEIDKF
jgi:hypothetical protein